jgi:hypothetical protein
MTLVLKLYFSPPQMGSFYDVNGTDRFLTRFKTFLTCATLISAGTCCII